MKDKYKKFLDVLFRLDISCIIAGLLMFFPVYWSIPNSFVKLGVALTNICLFIYISFMNISLLLYMPLLIYYLNQKDKQSKEK